MKGEIEKRVLTVGNYIAETGTTVRAAAAKFGYSKSSVHKDVSDRLKYLDGILYEKVRKVLDFNLSERHIRGGEATKIKYGKLLDRKEKKL